MEDVTGDPADMRRGLEAIFGGQSWGKDQDPEADPKPDPTRYESPDAPIREPVNFDPQTKLDSLQQPGEEPIDYDMLVDRFVRGLVAKLMSTINPVPDGVGGAGGGDLGIDPGQGPIGGDPPDETPMPVVTGSKGPKPFGDPDSPTGPGGPIPLQSP